MGDTPLTHRSIRQQVIDRLATFSALKALDRYNELWPTYIDSRMADSPFSGFAPDHDEHVVAYTKSFLARASLLAQKCTYEALPVALREFKDPVRAKDEMWERIMAKPKIGSDHPDFPQVP